MHTIPGTPLSSYDTVFNHHNNRIVVELACSVLRTKLLHIQEFPELFVGSFL